MHCPHCASTTTKEQTQKTTLGYRTFRCSACKHLFNERTGTPFNFLEYSTDVVLLVVLCRLRYTLSLRDLAELFLERASCSLLRRFEHGKHALLHSSQSNDESNGMGKQDDPGMWTKRLSRSTGSGAPFTEPLMLMAIWLIRS